MPAQAPGRRCRDAPSAAGAAALALAVPSCRARPCLSCPRACASAAWGWWSLCLESCPRRAEAEARVLGACSRSQDQAEGGAHARAWLPSPQNPPLRAQAPSRCPPSWVAWCPRAYPSQLRPECGSWERRSSCSRRPFVSVGSEVACSIVTVFCAQAQVPQASAVSVNQISRIVSEEAPRPDGALGTPRLAVQGPRASPPDASAPCWPLVLPLELRPWRPAWRSLAWSSGLWGPGGEREVLGHGGRQGPSACGGRTVRQPPGTPKTLRPGPPSQGVVCEPLWLPLHLLSGGSHAEGTV